MSLYWKTKALLCKSEVTYGVDPVPTSGANGMLVRELIIRPMEGQDIPREVERNFFGNFQSFPAGLHVVMTFKVELIGHAARGTAPAWSPIAKACGLAEVVSAGTSVVYNPVSSGHSSATLYFYLGGTQQKILGGRGTAIIRADANTIPYLEVTMTGLWAAPTDVAGITPTVSSFQDPLPVTKTNTPTYTINGVACVMRNFSLDFGNQVAARMLVGEEVVPITDSRESIATQIKAMPMATLNPFALAQAQTAFAVNLVHGSGSGKIVTVNAPNCRLMRPDSYASQDDIWEWPLRIVPLPSSGNDQYTITLT